MKNYPIITSFYTNDWLYPKYAKEMIDSCDRLGLKHHIKELDTTGSYLTNTRLKPKFIYDTITELKQPILWVDVDGMVLNKPDIFLEDFPYDFAGRHQRTGPKRMWHVGTLYFNYNEIVLDFLKEWVSHSSKSATDEDAFEKTWKTHQLSYTELPIEYFDILKNEFVRNKKQIIYHRLSKSPSKIMRRVSA